MHRDARDEPDRQQVCRHCHIAHRTVIDDPAAGVLGDDEACQRGRQPHRERLRGGVERHEGAAQFRLRRRGDDRHRRDHAPRYQHEEGGGADQPQPQRHGADMRDHQQRQQCGSRDQAVDSGLAAQVGPMADAPRADQRRRAAEQVDVRDVLLRDADVAHRVEGDVGDHREAGEDDQRGE